MSTTIEKKKEKKLKKFLDKNEKNRFKALVEYIEKCGNDQEVEGMFKANAFEIFSVEHEAFTAYELATKKAKYHEATVNNVHFILRKIFIHLAEQIKQRWHVRALATMIEKSLNSANKQSIRVSAWELLLHFYMDLGDPEKEFLQLFPISVDLQPFLGGGEFPSDFKLRTRVIVGDTVLVPRTTAGASKEDSIELLNVFFNFITEKPVNFEQWFGWYKAYYMTSFFPSVCKQIGMLDPNDDTGFNDHCPYDVQALFVDKLMVWFSNDNIISWLWTQQDNSMLMLEIFRQACLLPVSRFDTLKKYLTIFHDMLFLKPPRTLPETHLTAYRKWFFENLVFTVPEGPLQADHVKLVVEVLSYYKKMVQKSWQTLYPEIKDSIYISLIDLATRVLIRPDSGGADRSLCPIIVETVLWIWIRAKTVGPRMWALLHERIRAWFHRRDTIPQIKLKLIQMTLVLQNYLFTFEAWDRYMEKKNKHAATSSKKTSESQTPEWREPLLPTVDSSLQQLDWDYQSAQSIWYDLLEILRPLNQVEDPSFYMDGMDCLTYIVDLLLSTSARADFVEDLNSRPFISLISIFGPWLFEATRRTPVYNDGKALAYRALCRLVVRHSPIHLPRRLLAHFVDAVQLGLVDATGTKVSWAIIENTSSIFALGLPGVNMLIPYYVAEVRAILTKPDSVPDKVRESAIAIAASLICFPQQFSGLTIPLDSEVIRKRAGDEDLGRATFTYQELKPKLLTLFMAALSRDPLSLHQNMAVSALATMALNEITAFQLGDTQAVDIVTSITKSILGCTLNASVGTVAITSLSNLAQFYERLIKVDEGIPGKIVHQLAANIASKITASGFEDLTGQHFDCLLEWLMVVPVHFLDDPKLVKKLFFVIDQGLSVIKVGPADMTGTIGAPQGPSSEADPRKIRIRRSAEQALIYLGNFMNVYPLDEHYDILNTQTVDMDPEEPREKVPGAQPGAGEEAQDTQQAQATNDALTGAARRGGPVLWYSPNNTYVYSATDILIHDPRALDDNSPQALQFVMSNTHYLHYFQLFLAHQGLDQSISIWYEYQQYEQQGMPTTPAKEKAAQLVMWFLRTPNAQLLPDKYPTQINQKVQNKPELALYDLLLAQLGLFRQSELFGQAQEHMCRLTVRDYSGRYAWDSKIEYDWPGQQLAAKKKASDSRNNESSFNPNNMPEGSFEDRRDSEDAPPFAGETEDTGVNDLDGLLRHLSENRQDCVNAIGLRELDQPCPLPDHEVHNIMESEDLLLRQDAAVRQKLEEKAFNPTPNDAAWGCVLPEPPSKLGKLHATRLFLSHMGWNSFEKDPLYNLMDFDNPKFKRSLRQLDVATYGREVTKVGLVYVAFGQEDERAMFRNEQGSPLYSEFVEGMTNVVSIDKHRGYIGGLDRTGTVGTTLPYFHTATNELSFHEVVRMPTVHKDPQQILKKRHVGNDIIHVIWSDHARDYNPQTIVSQFNDAHIIIYPLPNGLFRISTAQKKEVSAFGPLLHNMVVSKELLPLLARQTAVNANQAVRYSHESYLGQFVGRKDAINDLLKRCQVKKPYNEYLLDLFRLNV